MGCLKVSHRKVQAGYSQSQRWYLGHMLLLELWWWVFCVPRLRLIGQFRPKILTGFWSAWLRFYLSDAQEKDPGKQGRLSITKAIGKDGSGT